MRRADNSVKLSESLHKRILETVLRQYTESRDYKQEKGYEAMMNECYRFYRGIPIPKPSGYEHQSNYWRPMTWSAIQACSPRLLAGIFATDPFVRFMGLEDKDMPNSENLTKYVYHKLTYEVPFALQVAKGIQNSLVYGYSVMFTPWITKQKTRYIRNMEDKGKRVAISKNIIDAPWCKCIPFQDVYPEPEVDTIYDADRTIIREMVSPGELYQRTRNPMSPYIEEMVAEILIGESKVSFPEEDNQHYQELDELVGLGSGKRDFKKVELLHYYGVFDFDDPDHPEISDTEVWITIANRTKVIVATYNPYDCQERPLFEMRPAPNTHGLIGIPMPMMTRDTQLESNDNMNFRLDQLNFIGNKVLKVRRHSDVYDALQGGNLLLYPGASIPVDNMDDLDVVNFGQVDPSLYIEDSILQDEFDRATGIRELSYGKGDSRARTATGTSLIIREANYRFDFMLKQLVPDITRMLSFIGFTAQQYGLDYNVQEERNTINLSDMLFPTKQNKYSFDRRGLQCAFQTLLLSSSTRGDKSYHFAMLQSLRQLLGNDQNINIVELDRQLLEEGEMKNIDTLLRKMPVTPPRGAAESVGSVVGGFSGLGGPTEKKSLDNNLMLLAKDKIV